MPIRRLDGHQDLQAYIASYSPPVRMLFQFGEYKFAEQWPDYPEQVGLTAAHVPELVRLATHADYANDADEPESSAWIHAWGALAQLGDPSAVPPLVAVFDIYEDQMVVLEEEVARIFSQFGAKAIEPLYQVFKPYKKDSFSPILAVRCLAQIVEDHPETRETCIDILGEQLKDYRRRDEEFNGEVAALLLDLKAVNCKDLIKEAFMAGKLDDLMVNRESIERVFNPRKFYRRDWRIALTGPNATPTTKKLRPVLSPVIQRSLPVEPELHIPFDLPFDVAPDDRDDPGLPELHRGGHLVTTPATVQHKYAPPLDGLLRLGEKAIGVQMRLWPDYLGMGIGREHIPDLIRMATDEKLLAERGDTLEFWAVPHAWYALAVLRAQEAAGPLIGLFENYAHNDVALENLPFVVGVIGPAAIPALEAYLRQPSKDDWSLLLAEDSLYWIARRHPESRHRCVALLIRQLEIRDEHDYDTRRFLMLNLIRLHATEALPLLERCIGYDWDCEMEITGDWFHAQYLLGILSREQADQRRVDYWREQNREEFGYPGLNAEGSTWLDRGYDFDERGNVDRPYVKTRATRWAYRLLARWHYGPFAVMALARTDATKDSQIAGIAVTNEKGEPLLDTLVRCEVPIAPEMTAQHGITQEQTGHAPTFGEIYPALRAALHDHSIVVYDDADRHLLDQVCSAHRLDRIEGGLHGLCTEYAYYHGQLNAALDACIMQSLENASRQQQVMVQPGLIGQCRMILGIMRAMANWLAETALPEEPVSSEDDDFEM